MRNSATLMVAPERLTQLKAIGAAHNLQTVSEIIAHLINTEIERGTISDTIPGFEVKATDRDRIIIRIGDGDAVPFTTETAAELADHLAVPRSPKDSGVLNLDADFKVIRRGAGIHLSIPMDAPPKPMSHDLARDLSRIITGQIDAAFSL
jgi:hypothetical protein